MTTSSADDYREDCEACFKELKGLLAVIDKLETLFAIAAECARNRELSLALLEAQVQDIIAHAKEFPK